MLGVGVILPTSRRGWSDATIAVMRRVALLVVAGVIAAGCGASGDEASSAAPATATPEVASATATAAPEPSPTEAPTATATPVPEPTPEPPAPDLELIGDGAYGVGSATVVIGADSDRPLTVQIWFPMAGELDADAVRYTFITGDYYESPRALAAGADRIAPAGPFPLVVYSHGSGGVRYIHSDYTETLASHGYVVAAPDHTGNTAVEQFLGTEDDRDLTALNRPSDVIAVIDAMTDPTDPVTGGYAAAVDAERIAVSGHSFGGFTAYATIAGHANEAGTSPPDDRVDAIIPIAPATGSREGSTLLTDAQLTAVDVPALVIVGTDDKTTPVEPNVERAWELTSSAPHYRLELVAAEHQSFTDVCDYVAAYDAGQEVSDPVREVVETFAVEGCSADDMPIQRVKGLTNTFALRFLASVFADAPMIDAADTAGVADIVYAAK